MDFFDKLSAAIARNQSLLVAGLDPNPEMLPSELNQGSEQKLINDLQQWLENIITATADLVCAYKPNLGFYTALGGEGIELLTRILRFIPPQIPVILDAKHGDLNTSTVIAHTVFSQWQVDAVTINPYPGQDSVAPFLLYADKAVFVLCHTSNPGAFPLQEYGSAEQPFYLRVVEEAKTWGTPEQLCLEIGASSPEIFTRVRTLAPERIILARSIWGENSQLQSLLAAGLDANGQGMLIPVPQDLLAEKEIAPAVGELRQMVNDIRKGIIREDSQCELWTPNVCWLNRHSHQELILQLYDIGCILFGEYAQASGETFSYYIDLRKIISRPQIFHQVLNAYAEILKDLQFERIAGIPYGSLPTATGLSLQLHYPMIFPRKEVKAHGTRRLIEGNFNPGESVVVVDDILISGKSAIEGAGKLESAGLMVKDIVVFIDHGKGVKERLKAAGYEAHSVLSIGEITSALYEAGRINEEEYSHFLEESI